MWNHSKFFSDFGLQRNLWKETLMKFHYHPYYKGPLVYVRIFYFTCTTFNSLVLAYYIGNKKKIVLVVDIFY